MTPSDPGLEEPTRPGWEETSEPRSRALLLSLCHHPDLRRVGEQFWSTPSEGRHSFTISRTRPVLRTTAGVETGPLADPHISRLPLLVGDDGDGGVLLQRSGDGPAILVEGEPLVRPLAISAETLACGVTIELSGRVVLLLQAASPVLDRAPRYGLIGESEGVRRIRHEIQHVAGLSLPTLLRGESGTGKELVARAIHLASPRASRPYVAVNLAALNSQTAVAELFGHTRGAFTGAFRAREGFFREADGGTLFLDEIGEAAIEVQVMLLRALETGEIQPVGGGQTRRVDVRVIAATDANLEALVLRGAFRPSLLHRLAGYEVWLPPLRQRRDDIPRLFHAFLAEELLREGGVPPDLGRFLTAPFIGKLIRYPWPGNIRQLHNFARQTAVLARSGVASAQDLSTSPWSREPREEAPGVAPPAGPSRPQPRARRAPRSPRSETISDAELVRSLESNRWGIDATARELGISKSSLYTRIDRCPHITKASDVPEAVIAAAYARCDGDLLRMATELRVSIRGLKLRLRALKGEGPSGRKITPDP
jgi:two-component system nitrogen regulation response regulator GlnG